MPEEDNVLNGAEKSQTAGIYKRKQLTAMASDLVVEALYKKKKTDDKIIRTEKMELLSKVKTIKYSPKDFPAALTAEERVIGDKITLV